MQDRKEKSLCFHCDEQYTNGHKCKKLFIIEAIWDSGNEEDVLVSTLMDSNMENNEVRDISFNIDGSKNIMRVFKTD